MQNFLANKEVISKETGEKFLLKDFAKKEIHKFSEIYCVLKGMDKYAIKHNLGTAMITITLPSEYHISSANFNHKTANDGGTLLQKHWNSCNKAFNKLDEFYFAFRVTDLHADNTPHFHILLHFNNELKHQYRSIIEKYFGNEVNNNQTINWLDIDRNQGTFIGYIVKSLLPTDGSIVADITNVERISSGRKIWQLRSHSISGLETGCIATWRELRKHIKHESDDNNVLRVLEYTKENDFYSFLIDFQKNNITPLYSEDKKIIGIRVCKTDLLRKTSKFGKQKTREITKIGKVNIINYSSNTKKNQKELLHYETNSANDSCFINNKIEQNFRDKINLNSLMHEVITVTEKTCLLLKKTLNHIYGKIIKII